MLRAEGLTPPQAHALGGAGSTAAPAATPSMPSSPAASRRRHGRARPSRSGAPSYSARAWPDRPPANDCARGWDVTLIERHPELSQRSFGQPGLSITMPMLSKDDNIMARLTRAAFLYALDYWDRLDGIRAGRCGVIHIARDAQHAQVQREIAAARAYPAYFARWMEAHEAGRAG
ncbi:hypothetical protein LP419_15300 [Massilia sp. H-1]|nr:hypothetical protein LP419_15300 [Massilia sp. H-1]